MTRKISVERVGEIMKAVLQELKNAGGQAKIKNLLERAEPRLGLSDYERAPYEKSGYIRWQSIVHFYSIDCVKAGYIQKSGGTWSLTQQGEQALNQPAGDFIRHAMVQYRAWKNNQPTPETEEETEADESKIVRQTAFEQAEEQARAEIEEHIVRLGAYDFQELVAELLTGMGYHVRFVAPPGQDGGIDIVAYKDPLGTSTPRIVVQVKHRMQKVTVKEVREMEGLLRKEGDTGLIVSSGGFTGEVERETRASSKHIETMDLDRLIKLWEQYYDSIPEVGRSRLPLVRLHFLAPTEE